jgi:hypothetical protein
MKQLVVFSIGIFAFLIVGLKDVAAQNWMQAWGWNRPSDSLYGWPRSITTDPAGNIIVAGAVRSPWSVLQGAHGFVRKYSPQGVLLWQRLLSQDPGTSIWGAATDQAGHVYLTGSYGNSYSYTADTTDFGGVQLVSRGQSDAFVLKLNGANGQTLWARNGGSAEMDEGRCIAVTPQGIVYAAGSYGGGSGNGVPAYFEGRPVPVRGEKDIYLWRLDTAGNHVWIRTAGTSSGAEYPVAMACDAAGNCYLNNQMSGGTAFFGGVRIYLDSLEQFGTMAGAQILARYDTVGNVVWARSIVGINFYSSWGYVTPSGVCVAPGGDIYVSGTFENCRIRFDGSWLFSDRASGGRDLYLVRYNSAGDKVWVRYAQGVWEMAPLCLDEDQAPVVAVTAWQGFRVDSVVCAAPGPLYEAMWVKFSATGQLRWFTAASSSGSDYNGPLCYHQGKIYVAGTTSGQPLQFGINAQLMLAGKDNYIGVLNGYVLGSATPAGPNGVGVTVYPNPVSDRLFVRLAAGGRKARLRVLDGAGRLVRDAIWTPVQASIAVGDLPPGHYLLQVLSEGGTEAVPFEKP